MTRLWIGFALVIAYGSVYPFDFQARVLNDATIQAFLDSCCKTPHSGDILANIVLFFPFGYLGILSAKNGTSLLSRALWVCLAGTVFALILQVVQIWLPSRNESLQDVAWNFFGIFGGALLGVLTHSYVLTSVFRLHRGALVPCLLIGSWLAYRLVPFVPSLAFDSIKASIRPLIEAPQIDLTRTFHDTVAWLVVAALLQRVQPNAKLDRYLPFVILGSFSLEILMVSNVLHASSVAGAVLALAWWWGGMKYMRWQAGVLAGLLCALLVASGLEPFVLSPQPNSFGWIPFYGLLGGSMYVNVLAICEKVFLYGGLLYLLWQTRLHRMAGLALAVAVVSLVEFAQVFFTRHTPEITDPLLLVLAALMMLALQQHEENAAVPVPGQGSARRKRRRKQPAPTAEPAPESIMITVNLRRSTAAFLDQLAEELAVTPSEACRQIVERMLEEMKTAQHDGSTEPTQGADSSDGAEGDPWTKRTLTLERQQYRALKRIAEEDGHSVSRALRNLLVAFIENTKQGGKAVVLRPARAASDRQRQKEPSKKKRPANRAAAARARARRSAARRRWGLAFALCLLVATGLFFLTPDDAPSQRGPTIVAGASWAGRTSDIIFDHHSHTIHSDGKLSVPELVELARGGGCEALAITDHSDTGRKKPFRLGAAEGGTASDLQLEEFRAVRRANPSLLLFGGVEINMPSYGGREHINVLVAPERESEILPRLRDTAEASIEEARSAAGGQASDPASDAAFLDQAAGYRAAGDDLLMIYNHPSRRDQDPNENHADMLRWNAEAPLFIGFAGAPGHQNAQQAGGYKGPMVTRDRWDPVVAEVGGTWDRLLSEGRQLWGAMAGSDYHNAKLDKVPCDFARTHVVAAEFSYEAVLQALRAGSFWADHGQILERLSFSAEVAGLASPAYSGFIVDLDGQQSGILVRVELQRGPGSRKKPLEVEFIGNCRTGETEVLAAERLVVGATATVATITPAATGTDGESCFVRARLRLDQADEPDLMAYTNPIRFLLR